jgi:hypothetical protein
MLYKYTMKIKKKSIFNQTELELNCLVISDLIIRFESALIGILLSPNPPLKASQCDGE